MRIKNVERSKKGEKKKAKYANNGTSPIKEKRLKTPARSEIHGAMTTNTSRPLVGR